MNWFTKWRLKKALLVHWKALFPKSPFGRRCEGCGNVIYKGEEAVVDTYTPGVVFHVACGTDEPDEQRTTEKS